MESTEMIGLCSIWEEEAQIIIIHKEQIKIMEIEINLISLDQIKNSKDPIKILQINNKIIITIMDFNLIFQEGIQETILQVNQETKIIKMEIKIKASNYFPIKPNKLKKNLVSVKIFNPSKVMNKSKRILNISTISLEIPKSNQMNRNPNLLKRIKKKEEA